MEREYKGIIIYDDGGIYEGHFNNGLENGKGRRILSNLEAYEGNYKDGMLICFRTIFINIFTIILFLNCADNALNIGGV